MFNANLKFQNQDLPDCQDIAEIFATKQLKSFIDPDA